MLTFIQIIGCIMCVMFGIDMFSFLYKLVGRFSDVCGVVGAIRDARWARFFILMLVPFFFGVVLVMADSLIIPALEPMVERVHLNKTERMIDAIDDPVELERFSNIFQERRGLMTHLVGTVTLVEALQALESEVGRNTEVTHIDEDDEKHVVAVETALEEAFQCNDDQIWLLLKDPDKGDAVGVFRVNDGILDLEHTEGYVVAR